MVVRSTRYNKECHGCYVHLEFEQCTVEPLNHHGKECPCLTCLVKSMCQKSCDKWTLYKRDSFTS